MTNGHLSSVFDAAGHQHVTIDAASVSKNAIVIAAQDDDGLSRFIDDVSSRNETRVRRGFAIVSVVGEGLRECAGITARILGAIREIDVTMISLSASGRTLSIVIDERDVHKAVNRIHDDLFGPRTESRALMLEREQSSRTAFSADLRR
jgi:aspartokinase